MSGRRRKPRDPVKNLRQRGGFGKYPEGSGWLDLGGGDLIFEPLDGTRKPRRRAKRVAA